LTSDDDDDDDENAIFVCVDAALIVGLLGWQAENSLELGQTYTYIQTREESLKFKFYFFYNKHTKNSALRSLSLHVGSVSCITLFCCYTKESH
jgi:hypothetical protein